MNCAAFEKQLERYQAGTLAEAERRESDQHVWHCPACRALLEAIQSGENAAGQVDLSQAVLSQTIGSACGRCRSLLGDLLEGVLEGVESELARAHLETCPSCGSLFRTMSEMAEVLPGMREMEPGPSFVGEVLTSVRALRQGRPRFSGILDFFRRLAERPGFSWEAAYLGALLVFGLFGTPFSPVPDASSRLLATLQNRDGLISEAGASVERWRQEALTVMGASDRARETVVRMTARSAQAAGMIMGQTREYARHSRDFLASAGKAVQARIADVYQQATGGAEASPKR